MKKTLYKTNTPWESQVGYSRAVRMGNLVFVSGTTATNSEGQIVGVGDAYAQTVQCIKNIQSALEHLGLDLGNVVRTRFFVTNISQWEDIGRAHSEFFGAVLPACTMVEVKALINPDLLVEMEADAVAVEARTGD